MLSFIRSLFFGAKTGELGEKPMVSTIKKTKSANSRRANSTPIKQVALLEEDEEDSAKNPTDFSPQGTIRSEVNFLTLPFFALSRTDAQKRMKTEYYATEKRGDKTLNLSWIVSANSMYGYPSPFDRKVYKTIEQIISNSKKPIKNPIPLGSLRNLAKLMGIGLSRNRALPGKSYKEIQDSLRRITHTAIDAKGTFYHKSEEKFIDASFHLFEEVVFIGEKLPNGEFADTNYVYLSKRYLDSINSLYTKPLDYTYYRSLTNGIASRLYELLAVKFYPGYSFIQYKYSTLCQLLPLTQQHYASDAKKILSPAHEELKRTGFLAKAEWQEIPSEKHDWYLHYYPGPRAKEEIKQFSKQEALPSPDDLESEQPTATSVPQQVDDVNEVVVALQNFGISKKQAVKLAKEHPHEYILEKLELAQWFRDTKSPLVAKNPAGFARKAIEDDYPAPPQYKSKKQLALEAEEKEQEEQLRLNCALCEGTGYYKVAENAMAECLHGVK
jgi:hypothetical protein